MKFYCLSNALKYFLPNITDNDYIVDKRVLDCLNCINPITKSK